VIKKLEEKGTKMLDVKVSIAVSAAVYLITYEADSPLTIEY